MPPISNSVGLTIAGFDPSSGAGVTADLQVFAAHGIFATSCITALTVQSTTGVRMVKPVSAETLTATLECLQEDLPATGVKIGMLATADAVRAVSSFLALLPEHLPVVLDPVFVSSSGAQLLESDALQLVRELLLPRVHWITPNRRELALLTNNSLSDIGRVQVEEMGRHISSRFPSLSLVATGGDEASADDFVLTDSGSAWMSAERIDSAATHGTGCAFSTALLCGLMTGEDDFAAAQAAKAYVTRAIQCAVERGSGRGPMNLLWPLESASV